MATALEPWHEFFVAAAGAGAVLLGLVFIGLSIHLEGRDEQPELVPLAIGSAVTLFYPVVISLILLMPPAQPWLPSAAMLIVGAFAALSSGAPIFDTQLRRLWVGRRRVSDWVRYTVPWLAALLLIAVAGWLLVEPSGALYATAIVIVTYLVVGTQNAWNLLLAGRFDVGAWNVSRAGREKDDS
jgi:hypothetical protein